MIINSTLQLCTLLVLSNAIHAYQLEESSSPSEISLPVENHRKMQDADDSCLWSLITAGDSTCRDIAQNGGGEQSSIVIDGKCNFNQDLGYYIAVCSDNKPESTVKFLRAHCANPDCSDCHEYVVGCDVGIDECGFVSRNELRDPSSCSERRNPLTDSVDASYGIIGNCLSPTCATQTLEPLPSEPCSWHMRTGVNCKEFVPDGPSHEILADGRCHYNSEIGYHIAVCTERFKLALRRAHCKNPDCTDCNEFFTRCDFLSGECGWVSRDFEYLSGQCFQIVDGLGERVFGYDFIGSCGNPKCEFSTNAIVPTIAPSKQPAAPTPMPTSRPTIETAFPIPSPPGGTTPTPTPGGSPVQDFTTPGPTPTQNNGTPQQPPPPSGTPPPPPTLSPTQRPTPGPTPVPSLNPTPLATTAATEGPTVGNDSSSYRPLGAIGWTTTVFTIFLTIVGIAGA